MAGPVNKGKPVRRAKADHKGGPEWTSGLKQLYDSVVEEPLPDAFKDLLAKLDLGKQ
ncbi:MAG: NepR family anti-sigma factor [Croceibacterium sp.]